MRHSNTDCRKQRSILERAEAVRKRSAARLAVSGHRISTERSTLGLYTNHLFLDY